MKKLFLIIALAFVAFHFADAQEIKLVADKTYGVGNDWDKVFDSYYDKLDDCFKIGLRKRLVMYDDGKAIVSHATRNRYSVFDANGKFLKDIVIHFADKNKKPYNIQRIGGRIGNLFYTEANNMGDIYFFDDNGLIVKELKIKYQSSEMLTLDDSHIAIFGGCAWSNKYRNFVSILNVNTGKDKIVCDAFKDYVKLLKDRDYYVVAESVRRGRAADLHIATINGQLVVSTPIDGLIRFYDSNGNKVSEKKVDWQPTVLSVEEQMKMQREKIKNSKEKALQNKSEMETSYYEKFIPLCEEGLKHITKPIDMGYFTIAIQGIQDNILYFLNPAESDKNQCHAYSVSEGKTVEQCTFTSDEYELAITKNRFVFYNGYLYGIQELKDYDGMPLRLVRFELK